MQVIAVAMGEPKHMKRYCGKLAPNITCLGQKDEQPYFTYGLKEGKLIGELASFDVLKAGMRAFQQGHVGGQIIGNPKMMPGTFIINPSGDITYTYYSQHAGDHPDIGTLLAQAQDKL